VIEKIHKAVKWAISVLSERDGSGSSSRVALLIVVIAVAFCLVFFTIHEHKLPEGQTLLGMSGILTAGATVYGANRLTNKENNFDAPNTPPS
jgi:hypothetical protein